MFIFQNELSAATHHDFKTLKEYEETVGTLCKF